MSKKLGLITIIICAAAIVLSIVSITLSCVSINNNKGDIQYVMYVGTNDKDTNEPVCTKEEAKVEAEKILLNHFGGYTIQEANGGWIDGEIEYKEYTLVIYLSDTTIDQVHEAAKDMIRVFNQSSILIQSNKTTTEFYGG